MHNIPVSSVKSVFIVVVITVLLSACASPIKQAEEYGAQDEWMKAVIEYRKLYAQKPGNVEYKSRLKQTEMKAADFYYQRGITQMEQGNLDGAIVQFQQGLAAMPDHSKLLQVMSQALARKEAVSLYQEALSYREAGKIEDAKGALRKTLQNYPDHKEAAKALAEMEKQQQVAATEGLALTSKAPITLNFRQTDLRTAFEFIAKSFGVSVVFDESFKSMPVTLFARDVTFEQGLNLLLTTTKTFYKKIGPNTILIIPDSKDKRGQYEDQIVRTVNLSTIRAKDMADILKGVLTIKKIIVNEQLNSLVIRDTEDVLKLVEKLVESNDRKPAEIIMEVEILEVNRTKADRLGLDFGSYQATANVPPYALGGSFKKAAEQTGTLTIPSVTLRFFKQDVDAKTLANPKIRVVNGKSAKIHIGDRVPLRASTIVDATGQVRTTYDYKDIGIVLNAEPIIHLDNSSTVKMKLEVSTLGENLGTADEPAYRIGTREAETYMTLRDGETAILGGLIRDDERNTRVKIPGLGDIPIIGALFTSYDDSAGRTDVLLTITPRVVRGWDLPTKAAREFYSGSENIYSDKPIFSDLTAPTGSSPAEPIAQKSGAGSLSPAAAAIPAASAMPASATASSPAAPVTPKVDVGGIAPAVVATPAVSETPVVTAASETAPVSTVPTEGVASPPLSTPITLSPLLAFAEPVYEVVMGREFEIKLVGQNLAGVTSLPVEVLYNPQLLNFVRGEPGDPAPQSFASKADVAKGLLQVKLSYAPGAGPKDNGVLARLILRGVKPGISYLVYRTPSITNAAGEPVNVQVRASRVVIK